jgi:hypothetical protein
MPPNPLPSHPDFDEQTLIELLEALHARTARHPDNPGLVAYSPRVPESCMAAACGVLHARGHPVYQTLAAGGTAGKPRRGWAIAATTDQPVLPRPSAAS